jgi:peptide chain release factor 3
VEADEESSSFKNFTLKKQKYLAHDKEGKLVFLSDSEFSLKMAETNFKDLQFHFTSEF